MAKDPAFLFYPNDWLGGTMYLSRHQKGCYMDLLIAQFNNGPLSLDTIKTVLGQDQANWTVLSSKFKQTTDGFWYNERLATEIEKRKAHSKKQQENAKKRWDKCGGNANAYTKSMPLENRNENEIKDGGPGEGKLSDLEAGKTVEFCSITLHRNYTKERIFKLWDAFMIQNHNEYYLKDSDQVKHFRNWIKTQPYEQDDQKIINNGPVLQKL